MNTNYTINFRGTTTVLKKYSPCCVAVADHSTCEQKGNVASLNSVLQKDMIVLVVGMHVGFRFEVSSVEVHA